MRLTLRTLIAWLDDKLTPTEVRTIGQQVAESPFARELVDRIQRVTRQRRLTVPNDTGPDSVDPNVVASYLDSHLTAEQVADYEKRCLTSDVHLAEVASVHQILSLFGHKAKVPPDAKLRMYRLVRGRETSRQGKAAPARPTAPIPRAPITEPISAWTDSVPRRHLVERFGPPALVLGLIVLMGVTAAYSLRPEAATPSIALKRPDKAAIAPRPDAEAGANKVVPVRPPIAPAEPAKGETRPDEPRPDETAPGDVGTIEAIQGVVLRPNADATDWLRVEANEPLKGPARLLNLAPFRNTLKLGKSQVDLVGSTDVVVEDSDRDQAARVELRRGQIVLRSGGASAPFAVRFEGQVVSILPPAGSEVGVERIPAPVAGQAEPAPPRLRIFVPDGQATLKVGDTSETVSGPADVSLQASGRFSEKGRQPTPAWVAETASSPFNKEIGDQFIMLIRPGRPILSSLVEAMDDPQKDVKRMAVLALGSIGAMEMVVEVAFRKEDSAIHRAGVEVLRSGLAGGGRSATAVRDALARKFDPPWAGVTERLLVGFRAEDARDEETMARLVEYLAKAPDRGTRELALDDLRSLTGRDSLEYDPDSPEGKGLKAWQDLVRKK